MQRYLIKRLFHSIITLFFVSILVFVLVRLSGDPTYILLSQDAPPEAREAFRRDWGLDKPILYQYGIWLIKGVQGDFGESILRKKPALALVMNHLWNTLQLVLVAVTFAVVLGVVVGVTSAVNPGGPVDWIGRYFSLLGQSAPTFWVGIMLMLLLAANWNLLPTSGKGGFETFLMPAFTLGWFSAAAVLRISKSSMLDVMGSEYIKTVRAMGLPKSLVVLKYALKNAAIPVVTMISLQFIALLGSSVIVETVFAWPGIGRLAVEAIFARDFPLIQTLTLVFATVFIIINLMVDILYGYIDPRIRYS
ncbi:MAG: ABC transporter permease [Thermodesulfobacteriota bacterium]